MDGLPQKDIPGTSRSSPEKLIICQEVEMKEEMEAPRVQYSAPEHLILDGVVAYDQHKLEEDMMEKMSHAFNERQKTVEQKRAKREIKQVETDLREVKLSIKQAERTLEIVSSESKDKETRKRLESVRCQKLNKEKQLRTLQAKLKRLQRKAGIDIGIEDLNDDEDAVEIDKATSSAVSWALTGKDEDERERLIKLGHMTPFGTMSEDTGKDREKTSQKRKIAFDDGFNDFLSSQAKPKKLNERKKRKKEPQKSVSNFKIPKKKNANSLKSWLEDTPNFGQSEEAGENSVSKKDLVTSNQEVEALVVSDGSDEEYRPGEDELDRVEKEDMDDEKFMREDSFIEKKRKKQPKYDPETGQAVFENSDDEEKATTANSKLKFKGTTRILDDGKLVNYQKRMKSYQTKLALERAEGQELPEDKDLGNGFKIPGSVWSRLYKYQRTGVRWLCELNSQKVGGILGDEMGLGKTIQIISFLSGMQFSNLRCRSVPGYCYEGLGPVLVVTPTTIMHQWVREFHAWWPPLRVAILHDSGTFDSSRAQLVDNIVQSNGILITSYERARINIEMLLDHGWHYVVLDEGHKIRNPEAAVTTALKLFRTPHRLILSGSPVQNNLRELWSLFDFTFPGKLGTLPVFMEQFSVPITQGGYSNATEIQVHTAYKCACKLRDTISPYLLRRMKRDVQLSLELPSKNEQVLFCRLSQHQIDVYRKYLDSDAVHSILTREMKVFAGLIQLRKICNHPDLYTGGPKIMVGEDVPSPHDERSFGFYKRSGKMLVISSLLKIWKKQGHKVLLFSQSKAMLDILEIFVSSRGYPYLTMHGGTSVALRQPLIKQFNEDPNLFVFLLTTRVGGLGVNLTGANRVVIYDPDWNPSTDSQAQERAWRIGQQRDVTIYRLLTSGTIEEKIYHRQIFKQFLTNRILKDPWQRRFFKSNDLHELFILKDYGNETSSSKGEDERSCKTETAAIFAGTGSEVKPEPYKRRKAVKNVSQTNNHHVPSTRSTNTISPPEKNSFSTKAANSENKDSTDKPQNQSELTTPPPKHAETNTENVSTCVSTIEKSTECLRDGKDCSASDNNHGEEKKEKMFDEDDRTQSDKNPGSETTKSSSLKESLMRAKQKFEERKRIKESCKKAQKEKKKRKPVIDGEIVKNVTAVKDYKPRRGADEELEEKSRKETDDYVLHRLFKRAGVHSALQHNTIMDSAHPDYALVEVEAERVAKESVRNLRLSRRQYQFPTGKQPSNLKKPRFGIKTDSSKKFREKDDSALSKSEEEKMAIFKAPHIRSEAKSTESDDEGSSSKSDSPTPLSASQLLATMRRRNHEEIHKQEELDASQADEESDLFGFSISQPSEGFAGTSINPTEHDELMEDLRNFIAFQCEVDGRARTSEIMSEFKDKVEPSHAAVFKSILKQLCTSEDSHDANEKIWFLKPEFR